MKKFLSLLIGLMLSVNLFGQVYHYKATKVETCKVGEYYSSVYYTEPRDTIVNISIDYINKQVNVGDEEYSIIEKFTWGFDGFGGRWYYLKISDKKKDEGVCVFRNSSYPYTEVTIDFGLQDRNKYTKLIQIDN